MVLAAKHCACEGGLLAAEIFMEIYHAVAYQLSLIVSIAYSACVTLAFPEG